MRLAIIRRRHTLFGGAERFIERLVPSLAKKGIETTIISENWPVSQHIQRIHKVRVKGITRASRFRSFQRAAAAMVGDRGSAAQGFDLVQSHERISGVDLFRLGDGVHLAWLDRLKREAGLFNSWLAGIDAYHRAVISTEKSMAKDPRLHYIANSSLIEQELKNYLNVPKNRISLIPNGVDTKYFLPPKEHQKKSAREKLNKILNLKATPETFIVAFVGSGFRRKGVFPLIKACAQLENCMLIIAGRDKELERGQQLAVQLGATDRIRLVGPVADVRQILEAADVFALPSLYDPSSNAVLEALSCGLPVVLTHDVGMASEIENFGAGFVCQRSSDSIIDSMAKVREPAVQIAMGKRARTLALIYDQSAVIEQWLTVYRDIEIRRKNR